MSSLVQEAQVFCAGIWLTYISDRFKHAFKDLIGTDLTKFQDKMSGIEGLKEKIRKVSEVAFQEKSFKQSGGRLRFFNASFLESR